MGIDTKGELCQPLEIGSIARRHPAATDLTLRARRAELPEYFLKQDGEGCLAEPISGINFVTQYLSLRSIERRIKATLKLALTDSHGNCPPYRCPPTQMRSCHRYVYGITLYLNNRISGKCLCLLESRYFYVA